MWLVLLLITACPALALCLISFKLLLDLSMEVIAVSASVTQLAAYTLSSARYLQHLYTELHTCHSAYRSEETNIILLLDVIKRLSCHNIEDSNPVLPILIDISGLACQILQLLQPRKLWGFNWIPITAQDKLSSSFETLTKKRSLLHLYVSQASYDAITDLRKAIDRPRKSTCPDNIITNMVPSLPNKISVWIYANSRGSWSSATMMSPASQRSVTGTNNYQTVESTCQAT